MCEQPFVMVRHTDNRARALPYNLRPFGRMMGKVLGIFVTAYRRNVATHDNLEKMFGLSPSPTYQTARETPDPQIAPNLQFGMGTAAQGRSTICRTTERHPPKNTNEEFQGTAKLVKALSHRNKANKKHYRKEGVAYGLDNQKGYRTRFINGSTVHQSFSGPKTCKGLWANQKSKATSDAPQTPALKQIGTTYGFFKNIVRTDARKYLRNIRTSTSNWTEKEDTITGYFIYDNRGYVKFTEREAAAKT